MLHVLPPLCPTHLSADLRWSAGRGTRDSGDMARRGAGIISQLLTTMHMTLLGALIALAPRTLFGTTGFTCFGVTLSPLVDQHLGGVVMLLVGAGSYLLGGLALLSRLLRDEPPGEARSEEHTSELQSLMRISYAVFCLKIKQTKKQ